MREFDSLAAFARHLERMAAAGPVVTNRAAKAGAKLIETEAKRRIGEYQDGIGPFGAWPNLAEATVQDRLSKGFTPDDPLLRTGDLRASIDSESEGGAAVVGSPSNIALYQDLGTARIPPRPIFGPAAMATRHEVQEEIALHVLEWLSGVQWPRLS
jgi:hypothetical protein